MIQYNAHPFPMSYFFYLRFRFTFVAADYSQIEMRILAHFCQDPQLIQLFNNVDGDVYKAMASLTMRKPIQDISETERTQAKTVCLGLLYTCSGHANAR